MMTLSAYTFKNAELLETALTHPSYANERNGRVDNQRLEFLGDAVLSLCVSTYLYRKYPKLPEGALTRIRAGVVSEAPLAALAKGLNLGSMLKLGRGEEASGGRERPSVLADAMEALIAAIYLDGSLEAAISFVTMTFASRIDEAAQGQGLLDYKTDLQERIQQGSGVIVYEILREEGPHHDPTFTAQVAMDGIPLGKGKGRSKKDAEQQAAKVALAALNAKMR